MDDTNFESVCSEIVKVAEGPLGVRLEADDWIKLDHLFFWNLHKASEAEMIQALAIDINDSLPFYMKIEIYQRLILINDSNALIFQKFAEYLRNYSNNWNYLAEYFELVDARLTAAQKMTLS